MSTSKKAFLADEKRAAFYSREVADVCLNCKRPMIGRECGMDGCPAYRAAMKRVADRHRQERLARLNGSAK